MSLPVCLTPPVTTDARATIAALAQAQHGLFTVGEARAHGVSDRVLAGMVQRGELVRAHLGVYRMAAAPWTWTERQHAAVRAGGPKACVAYSGAATLLGVPGVPVGRPEILVPTTRLLRIDGVRVHRTRDLPPEDVTIVEGVRCTTGPRTVVDLAGRFSHTRRIALVDDAIACGAATRGRMFARATALRMGRAGVATVVDVTAPGADGTFRSTLERRFAHGVRREGLPAPDYNRPLRLRGRVYVPDALWGHRDLVVELHGLRFHDTPADRGRDDERLNAFTEMGLRVLVFTWRQVLDEFAEVARLLQTTLGCVT